MNFDCSVTGLDYSEIGCEEARLILENNNVEGEIVCCDFFSPPESMLNRYDVVISFGVLEHFENTSDCTKAFSRFLRPGGLLLTVIPNMNGIPGLLDLS